MKQKWSEQTTEQVLAEFNTSTDGLTNVAVISAQKQYGQNKLPEQKTDSIFLIFLRQFTSPLVYILLAVSILVFILGEWTDACVIAAVLLLNAVIGAIQEGRAQNTLAALKKFVRTSALVRRNGVETIIPDEDVVPGDIVLLREGDKIPADGRVLISNTLTVDEASLTGESEPVAKFIEPDSSKQPKNMLFKGTHAVSGRGEMIVTAIGLETEIGKISATVAKEGETEIPLQRNIRALSKIIMLIVLVVSAVLFLIGILMGTSVLEMVKTVVSLAVSVIPEGLPIVLTLVLANGVWRMTKRKALVKKLAAVEALGQTDIIAVDKTGTITKNELVVECVVVKGKTFFVQGTGYQPKGDILLGHTAVSPLDIPELVLAGKIASFASSELLFDPEKQDWQVTGDPTEGALLVLAEKIGFKPDDMRLRHPVMQDIPFDYQLKFHGAVYKDPASSSGQTLCVVGAPETIAKLSGVTETEVHDKISSLVNDGLRVVAFAFAEVNSVVVPTELPRLTFGGLYAMRDALHPEVPSAVQAVQAGGIKVIMITGDHKLTAAAIAKQANILRDGDTVLTGEQLDAMNPAEFTEALQTVTVFARVTPFHKLRIVQALKVQGKIVAMTGDGVNDVPPLVAADLGVAMGVSGTEVTKEAADIVLLDDNFTTIAAAVEEGRGIYRTIERALLYLFSTGMGELFTIAAAIFIGWPLPVVAVQILWLNFVTDGFLTIAFAMEPNTEKLQLGKFKTSKYLINGKILTRMILMGSIMMVLTLVLFYYYKDGEYIKATTIALTELAVLQWINAWNCRSEKTSAFRNLLSNPYLILATACVIGFQLLAVYNPFFQKFLKTVPLDSGEWLLIVLMALPLLLIEELRKIFVRR